MSRENAILKISDFFQILQWTFNTKEDCWRLWQNYTGDRTCKVLNLTLGPCEVRKNLFLSKTTWEMKLWVFGTNNLLFLQLVI